MYFSPYTRVLREEYHQLPDEDVGTRAFQKRCQGSQGKQLAESGFQFQASQVPQSLGHITPTGKTQSATFIEPSEILQSPPDTFSVRDSITQ